MSACLHNLQTKLYVCILCLHLQTYFADKKLRKDSNKNEKKLDLYIPINWNHTYDICYPSRQETHNQRNYAI